MIKIRKGLNLPIQGTPKQNIEEARPVGRVALVGDDYVGLKPKMEVQVGDSVRLGQLLFTDKKTPGVGYTSPGSGKVAAINRGAKRKFESIVIQLKGKDEEAFKSFKGKDLASLNRNEVQENLIDSGLWTALRTRPYSKVPLPDTQPHSIFVTAMDTEPLAPNAGLVIKEREDDFVNGLKVLTCLTDVPLFVCKAPGAQMPGSDIENVKTEEFAGPHPAGLSAADSSKDALGMTFSLVAVWACSSEAAEKTIARNVGIVILLDLIVGTSLKWFCVIPGRCKWIDGSILGAIRDRNYWGCGAVGSRVAAPVGLYWTHSRLSRVQLTTSEGSSHVQVHSDGSVRRCRFGRGIRNEQS